MIIVAVPEEARASLEARLADLASSPYRELEEFLLDLYPIFAQLPRNVLANLTAMRNDPRGDGSLLVTGLPVDDDPFPTPVAEDGQATGAKTTVISEACALGVAQVLGEPVGYWAERDGAVVQWLFPIPSEATATSSSSSDTDLEFHTDFNFDPDNPQAPFNVMNPDFIVLSCVRADPEGRASTLYADARALCRELSDDDVAVLGTASFQFAASYSFTGRCGDERIWSAPSPVLKGPPDCPEISVDLLCGVRGVSDRANVALDHLREVAHQPGVASSVQLRPGDVLVMDNRKGAHGRTAFPARFDGSDRLVQRVYVRRSLWELRKPVIGSRLGAIRTF